MNQVEKQHPYVPLACFWLVFLAAASLRVTLTSLGPVMSSVAEDMQLSSAVVSFLVTIPITDDYLQLTLNSDFHDDEKFL